MWPYEFLLLIKQFKNQVWADSTEVSVLTDAWLSILKPNDSFLLQKDYFSSQSAFLLPHLRIFTLKVVSAHNKLRSSGRGTGGSQPHISLSFRCSSHQTQAEDDKTELISKPAYHSLVPSLLGCVGITSLQRKDFYSCLHAALGKWNKKINAPKSDSPIFNPQSPATEGEGSVLNTALGESSAQPSAAPLTPQRRPTHTRTRAQTAPTSTAWGRGRALLLQPKEAERGRSAELHPRPAGGPGPGPGSRRPAAPRTSRRPETAARRPQADMSEFGAGAELPGWVADNRSWGGKGGRYRAESCGKGGEGAARGRGGRWCRRCWWSLERGRPCRSQRRGVSAIAGCALPAGCHVLNALPPSGRALFPRGVARGGTCRVPAGAAQLPIRAEAPGRRRCPGAAGEPAGNRGCWAPGAAARGRGARGRAPLGAAHEHRREEDNKVLYVCFSLRF